LTKTDDIIVSQNSSEKTENLTHEKLRLLIS